MPIIEFRCLKCNAIFEFLFANIEEKIAAKCPSCQAEELTRVMSRVLGKANQTCPDGADNQIHTRRCSSGSCSTLTIPGHSK